MFVQCTRNIVTGVKRKQKLIRLNNLWKSSIVNRITFHVSFHPDELQNIVKRNTRRIDNIKVYVILHDV